MSDFRISQIAGMLLKDERSIRRWCISGRVEGAYVTAGGHWRVKASGSIYEVCKRITASLGTSSSVGAVRRFRPRERDASVLAMRGITKLPGYVALEQLSRDASREGEKLSRYFARGRGRAFLQAVEAIDQRLQKFDFDAVDLERVREGLERVLESPPSPEAHRAILVVACGVWAWERDEKGGRGVAGAAKVAGIARTTFLLHFADYLPTRTDANRAPDTCGFHEYSSDEERRAYASAARQYC